MFKFYFLVFWPCHAACGISVLLPGIEPVPPQSEAWSLNHLTAREAPVFLVFYDPSLEGEMDDKMQRRCYWEHGKKTLGRLRAERRQRFAPGGMGECLRRAALPHLHLRVARTPAGRPLGQGMGWQSRDSFGNAVTAKRKHFQEK